MNTRTALIALVMALIVAAASWFLLRPPPKPAAAPKTWLAALDPAQVRALSVKWPDGQTASIDKSAVPGVWLLTGQGKSRPGAQPAAWPVGEHQVSAAIRLIKALEDVPPSEGALPASGTIVTFKLQGANERQITLGQTALGGKTFVLIHGPPDSLRLGDAGLNNMFQDGLLPWRLAAAICSSAGDAVNSGEISRVRLESIGMQVKLGQVKGRWGIQFPLAAPADQAACAQLVQILGKIAVKSIVDENLADSTTGLAAPSALIETESDFRIAEGGDIVRRVLIQRVTVGGPVDSTGAAVYARVRADWKDPSAPAGSPVWGPALVILSSVDLLSLKALPTPYLSRQTIETPGADLSGFVLSPDETAMQDKPEAPDQKLSARAVRLVRTIDGWRYKPELGEVRVPAPAAATQIDALVHLICDQPADAVGLEAPTGTRVIAKVAVASGESAIVVVGVGVAEVTPVGGGGKTPQTGLVIRCGPVFRVYFGKAALDIARWIREELPPEG